MRTPTPFEVAYAWWKAALLRPPSDRTGIPDDPQPGFFKRRLCKGGVFVPARICLRQDICPETGELMDDETLVADVNGQPVEPDEIWSFVASNPISQAEHAYLTARQGWAERYAPADPAARPFERIDHLTSPVLF